MEDDLFHVVCVHGRDKLAGLQLVGLFTLVVRGEDLAGDEADEHRGQDHVQDDGARLGRRRLALLAGLVLLFGGGVLVLGRRLVVSVLLGRLVGVVLVHAQVLLLQV